MIKQKFDVSNMHCAACSAHVNNTVEKLDGIKCVNVNLLQNSMTVEYDESVCSPEIITDAVVKAGYGAKLITETDIEQPAKNTDKSLNKLVLSICFLIALMYFSMGNMMWGLPSPAFLDHHKSPVGHALIQLILLLPILIIYREYFVSGFKKLFKGAPNMDTLIAVGATVSVLYGLFSAVMITYSTIALKNTAEYESLISAHMNGLYFEAAGMILTLVSLGKFLENLSKKKTTDAIKRLMDLAPETAVVIVDGIEKEIPAKDVKIGDTVIVKKGCAAPVDGVIIEGGASFNQSNITGESIPVYKTKGEEVFSSTVITAGYVKIRAIKVGKDTSISNIIKLVEEASNSKAPISKLADRISAIFVPVIFAISLLTFSVNLLIQLLSVGAETSAAVEIAFRFAVTVIVIACPCALGLATPVAIMVGTGKGAENGLIIKNAEILENARYIKTVVLDKTGTITEGKPAVVDYHVINTEDESKILSAVYSLEQLSEHPLAQAIVEYAKEKNTTLLEPVNYESIEGRGVKGKILSDEYYIGNAKVYEDLSISKDDLFLYAEEAAKSGKTPLFILKNGKPSGVITVKDKVKTDSAKAVAELNKRGIKVVMLTGDNIATANAIAEEVGVDEVIAGVMPKDKNEYINSLKTDKKHLVAMVGDGVNDAPALSTADVGIAVGGGSDIAVETGDVVLLRKSLFDVVNYIDLSKRVLKTIKISLFWAFFYNLICVFLASGALYYVPGLNLGLKPEYGSVAMSLSSVSVVLTALTINFFKPKKS